VEQGDSRGGEGSGGARHELMEEEEGVEGEGMDNNNKKMSSKPSNWFLESVVSFQET